MTLRCRCCRWLLPITALAICLVAWRAAVRIEAPRFHRITLPSEPGAVPAQSAFVATRDTRVLDVAFSPDGSSVYAYLKIGCLDVFSLLVSVWPEIALALIALIAVVFARLLMRRPPTSRDPHCRRCDYSLAHATSDVCPECGLELTRRNRVRGCRPRRRLVAPLVLIVAAAAAYVPLRGVFDRSPEFGDRFHWPSSFLFDQAYHRGFVNACMNHRIESLRLVQIDAGTGRVRRTLMSATVPELRPWMLMTDRSGTSLALLRESAVTIFDAKTGRTRLRFEVNTSLPRVPVTTTAWSRRDFYCDGAFSPDGSALTLGTWGGTIERWSVTNGALLVRRAVLPALDERSMFMLDGLVSLRDGKTLLMARRSVGSSQNTVLLRIDEGLDPVGTLQTVFEWQVDLGLATSDGSRWFGIEMGGGTRGLLVAGDTASLEASVRDQTPGQLFTLTLALSPDERLLFAGRIATATRRGHVAAYDPQTLELVCRFGGSKLVPGCLAFSPDGRTLLVAGSMSRGAGQQYVIAWFDLPEVSAAPP